MAILEDYRGKGLGRMIVEEFAQISEQNKILVFIKLFYTLGRA